ncbi:MAG: hypothetical protein J6A16_08915 [Oscillospiraceae bacterium]|nr:hypothetical protein [Oscillospiraceae bacterium]
MTKQIREYLEYIHAFMAGEHTHEEYAAERELLLKRIELFQHERLIHLLVTLAFAVFFLLSLFMFLVKGGAGLMVLALLFLVLLIPYIKHYYFLENSVQKLYILYYKIEKN